MVENLDEKVRAALREIPDDPGAPARLAVKLGRRRSVQTRFAIAGAASGAGSALAGFVVARLQGPIEFSDATGLGDTAMILLLGAI
ncbi:MAG: hypothetical protein AAFR35_13210 [Pseudomonadota bacterium]